MISRREAGDSCNTKSYPKASIRVSWSPIGREELTAQEPNLLALPASWRTLPAQLSSGREHEPSRQTAALPLLLCDLQFFFQPSVYFLEEKNVYKSGKKKSLSNKTISLYFFQAKGSVLFLARNMTLCPSTRAKVWGTCSLCRPISPQSHDHSNSSAPCH